LGLLLLETKYRKLPFPKTEIVAAKIHRSQVTPVRDARRLVSFPACEQLEVVDVGQGVLQVLGERAQGLATPRLFGVLWTPVIAQLKATATPLMRTSVVDVWLSELASDRLFILPENGHIKSRVGLVPVNGRKWPIGRNVY
jgi:hypothetical protein